MLPNAVRRLTNEWAIKPGERAVIVSADENGLVVADDLHRAGTEVARVVDLRKEQPRRIEATGEKGRLARVTIDSETIDCDLLVVSGGRQPAYSLLAQAGARVEYDAGRGIFVPTDLPANVEVVGGRRRKARRRRDPAARRTTGTGSASSASART